MRDFFVRSDKYSNVLGLFGLLFLISGFYIQVMEISYKVSILFTGIGIILIVYFLAIILFGYESNMYESNISELERFVDGVSEDYNSSKFNKAIKHLKPDKRREMIPEIINKFISNVESKSRKIRMETIRLSKKIIPDIQRDRDIETYSNITDKFSRQAKIENDKKVYLELADVLEESARWFLKEEFIDKTTDIVGLFRTQIENKDDGFKNRWKLAEKVLRKLPDEEFINILIKYLRSGNESDRISAYNIIKNLEEGAILPIIRSLENVYDKKLREVVITCLKNFGEPTVILVLRELERKISSNYAKIIIDVLPEIGYEDIVKEHIEKRVNSYSKVIKPYIIELMEKIS